MKILVTVGTRPEIIRLSSIIKALSDSNIFELILVHTGQNYDYELNEVFFDDLGLGKPNYFLNAVMNTPVETVGKCLIEIDRILDDEKPDVFLVLGDTNSCLTSYAAKRRKIPVFHMEAGNRCFDENVPEEINRKIVDSIADVNLTYSNQAKEYLVNEGHNPQTTFVVGSPMYEVVNSVRQSLNKKVLSNIGLEKDKYVLLSFHRDENVSDESVLTNVVEAISELCDEFDLQCVFSVHPRTRKQLEKFGIVNDKIIFLKPLGYIDYLSLQVNSRVVLSDSGTINEESDILGFKAVNLRRTNERPEAADFCITPMSGTDKEYLKRTIRFVLNNKNSSSGKVECYSRESVSHVVLGTIISMTQFVNHYTWRK
jgi:UDP-N-acetylglucosamine 2-epimerase (non-hydrolysing)